jgi:GTPase SAR1 family protein
MKIDQYKVWWDMHFMVNATQRVCRTRLTINIDFVSSYLSVCANVFFFFFQLQLWDTAGQERFRKSMVHHYYRNVHAVVLVYDVTKMSSFQVSVLYFYYTRSNTL